MKRSFETAFAAALLSCLPALSIAQAPQGNAPAPPPGPVLPPAQQVAAAVQAAPAEMRDGAAVLGYNDARKLVTLREGKNEMVCLADDPSDAARFHVACYHKALEPFMARGRSLRLEGVKGEQVDTVRFKEIKDGKLKMPSTPSALYTLTGPPTSYDAAANKVTGARWLYVVYVAGATGASMGLSEKAAPGVPWVMFPGTPKAHIMFFTGM
jgi:hypothetical protein